MLRAAVVGTGFIGPAHVEALRRIHVDVVGLVGSTAERAQQKANELGVKKAYDSFDSMLADPTVDVVHLATPNYLHYPHAKAALLAGKHVICEKPLAMTSKESGELVRLASETQRVNAVCFNSRFYPMVHQARAVVQSGELGDLYIVHGSYLQDWLLLPTDWNWRLEPSVGGTLRVVGDIGSHWLDMITFVTGLRMTEVLADLSTFLPVRQKPTGSVHTFDTKAHTPSTGLDQRIHTEDYASILLRFENGARGVLTVSQVSAGHQNRLNFEINGSTSSLAWTSERPSELWMGHRDRAHENLLKDSTLLTPAAKALVSYLVGHDEGYPDTFQQLFHRVYAYIEAGSLSTKPRKTPPRTQGGVPEHGAEYRPDFPTFADGHYVQVLLEAITESARQGRWTRVEI
jgi:predicted dehydrogenase